MTGRKEETLTNVTLLGNQGTEYAFSYNPSVLETLTINIQIVIILLNLTALSLRRYVQKPINQILQRFILATFLM